MRFHRSLDEVFHSWTHVAVLRVLRDTTVGYTGNQVARQSHMHPRSAFKALGKLELMGLIHRRRGGRDHLFTLNRESFLLAEGVLPLLDAERNMLGQLETNLRETLRRKVVACILFGSVAREEETAESDVDLCCIVRNEKEGATVQKALDATSVPLYSRFGAKIAPVYFTETTFRAKAGSALVKAILAEGTIIVGRIPRGLSRG